MQEDNAMNIIGKWKIKELHIPTPEGVQDFTPETLPEGEEYEEFAQMARTLLEFTPEGRLDTLMPVPEEMMEQAQSEGMEIRDGFAVLRSTEWKEQDGRFYYNTEIEGEMFGETVDPFMEITVQPDGTLLYAMGVMTLERA